MTSKLLSQAIGLSGTTGNSTNITLSSNGSLQLAANGGTDIFISANDNIGFGNNIPAHKVSINGDLFVNTQLSVGSNNGSVSGILGYSNSNYGVIGYANTGTGTAGWSDSSAYGLFGRSNTNFAGYFRSITGPVMYCGNGTNEFMRVDNAGRLLVGLSSVYGSSTEKLTVNGMVTFVSSANSNGNAPLYIYNTDTTASNNQPFIYFHDGGAIRGQLGCNYTDGAMWLNGAFGIRFRNNSGEVARFDSSGNFGLGYAPSSPYKLDVYGNARITGYFYTSTSGVPQLTFNSAGANYGFIQNDVGGTWSLAYGTNQAALGTPVLSWNSSSSVSINTITPDTTKKLHIYASGSVNGTPQLLLEGGTNGYGAGITMQSRTSAGGSLVEMARVVADGDSSWNTTASTQNARLSFWTTSAGTSYERMRILGSGEIGIATGTNALYSDLSVRYAGDRNGSGSLSLCANPAGGGGASYILMGNSDSGGTAGPNVIVASNRYFQFGAGNSFTSRSGGTVSTFLYLTSTVMYPGTDNGQSCGQSGNRWSAIWAASGTIQTSDLNAKKDIVPTPLGLDFINALKPVAYKFKVGHNITQIDYTNKPEGENIIIPVPGKRQHFGLIAQQVKEVLPEGMDFGGWVLTDIEDPNSEQGLRYEEFISPMIKAIQELNVKLETALNEIAELKNK